MATKKISKKTSGPVKGRVQATLPSDYYQRLKAEAEQEHRSVSNLVSSILMTELDRRQEKNNE